MVDQWFAPPRKTKLGRHRRLSPLAGVHVSPLVLGGMSIGDAWVAKGMGVSTKESTFALLDAFYDAGGNFIDTANFYQDETSEKFVGEWMEERGVRDQMVIATKYTTNFKVHEDLPQKTHYIGNNLKSMTVSVEKSLEKLRTKYIDILYVHWWDWDTSVEEVMNGLNNLVQAGKVLYLGASNTPAWIVSKANNYAKMSGKVPFVVYSPCWNVLQRDVEREILPMCREEGIALCPWNVLASGKIRTDAEEERRRQTGENGRTLEGPWERNENEKKICAALEKVAEEVGAKSITAIAIAYVMQKTVNVFPVVGGRKVEHLMANIEALEISLTPEHIKYIESILPFDPGYPASLFGTGTEYNWWFQTAGAFDKWPLPEPIRPAKN